MYNHHSLRELAKIGSGIVIADLISVVWLSSTGLLPMSILGVIWTNVMVPEIIVFDVAILILLVHYGWHIRLPISSPSERVLLTTVGIIFLIVAILHFIRITFGLRILLGTFAVPLWLSWFGVAITVYLSYASFHFAAHRPKH